MLGHIRSIRLDNATRTRTYTYKRDTYMYVHVQQRRHNTTKDAKTTMDAICTSCHAAAMFPWEMSQKNKTFVSMASRSVSGKMVELNGRGPQPFKMSGQMYHLTPSAVFPDTAKKPKFSQIYVFDQDNEIKTPSSR